MSKTSYTLIGIIAAALLYMGAARLYEYYEQYRQTQEIAAQNDGDLFTFQKIPVSLAAPEVELMQNPIPYQPQFPEIYLETPPLSADQQQQQARQTVESIVSDFQNSDTMQHFNQDLQQSSNGTVQNLADLSTRNLPQILQQNPEVARVVEKHLKNPDFSKAIDEIFNNPNFQQSVQKLQGKPNPQAIKTNPQQ